MQKKIVTLLMKKGNKKGVILTLKKIYSTITRNLFSLPIPYFFSLIFFKLNTNIEIRKVVFKNRVHFIPFPVKKHRKVFLMFK